MKYRDDQILKKFGLNLRQIRTSKGISQEALAMKANIPASQIGRIERGEINTTISTAHLISQILKIPFSSLFDL